MVGMGMLGMPMMGGVPVAEASPATRLKIAADERSRTVLVRGEARELDIAADLVAVLDTPKDKPLPKVRNLVVFPVKHADADRLAELLRELDYQVMSLGPRRVLITHKLESLPDLETFMRELDVPERNKEQERNKLISPQKIEKE